MRVFDCSIYDGRLDVLLARFEELADVVDVFVVVEPARMWDGTPRPPRLRADWSSVRSHAQSLRYVVVDEGLDTGDENRWLRQLRNAVRRGLVDAAEEDVVILSDPGELLSAEAIRSLRGSPAEPCTFVMSTHSDPAQRRTTMGSESAEARSVAASAALLAHREPARVRQAVRRGELPSRRVEAGGWCFTPAPWDEVHPIRPTALSPVVICPYLYPEDRARVVKAFDLTSADGRLRPEFYFWQDTERIGPERAFEHCWNQFPERDIIIIHTDMRPRSDDSDARWYRQLVDFAARLPEAGLVAMDLLFPDVDPVGRHYVQCAGGTLDGGELGYIGGSPRILHDERFSGVRAVPWVTFGGVYIRREVLDMVGDFDRTYQWAYVMDADYCLEAHVRGQQCFQVPVSVLHEENVSTKPFLEQQEYKDKVAANVETFRTKWKWLLHKS